MPTSADYSHAQRMADLGACRHLLAGGSRSFYAASFLLPRRVRHPATALYAFCRLADDAIDTGAGGEEVLNNLRERLASAYRGQPWDTAFDRAFADTVTRFGVPSALLEALIDGFAWDAAQRRYETLADLLDYAARVAGTVGAMMSLLMERREPDVVARACDLGMAMQLTNIARDVGEDARAGRIYLPLRWMREAGIDPEAWLVQPTFTAQIGQVIERLLAAADELYNRADMGIARLPADCRPGIMAARLMYTEIGREVLRQGCDSVSARAVVTSGRKLSLLFQAMNVLLVKADPTSNDPCADASRFLVAATNGTAEADRASSHSWWDVRSRLIFVLDLFESLERREREARNANKDRVAVERGREPAMA